jgi:basic membrane protein A
MLSKPKTYLTRLTVLLLITLLAAACGGDTQPAQEQAGGDSAASSAGAAEDAAVESIALLLPGKKDDKGYSQTGYDALQAVAQEYGVETAVAEDVAVGQQTEVYRDFAAQGFDLIVGWGGQYEDGASEAAEEFPDTTFVVSAGSGGNDANFGTINHAGEQWNFLTGYVAGKVTKSGKVGAIGGPCAANTAAQLHGFEQGVMYANPDAEVLIAGLDDFDDPALAKEAALAQIDQGADVLYVNLNTGNLGVFEAAEENKDIPVFVVTEFTDQHEEAPDVILTSATRKNTENIATIMESLTEGTFAGNHISIEIQEDDDAIAPFRGLAPDELFDEAKEIQAQLARGEIEVEADSSCPY